MIIKTIISAIVLFILYNLFLAYMHPAPGPGQHQWQKNMILVQDYADQHQGDPVVLVGTSLSARLYNNLLPDGYYNLSLAGGSIFEGLALIKQSTKKPKYLLIESNLFYKDPDKEAIEGVFDPPMVKLRKYVPSFREENQPANLLSRLLGKAQKSDKPGATKPDTGIENMLLKQRIKEYQALPDSQAMTRNFKLLKDYITGFEAEGIKVILYEIPMNCAIYQTPRYIIPKQKIIAGLPQTQYKWMGSPDCKAYHYSDGSHMEYESASDFVKWFVGEFERIKRLKN